MSKQKLSPLLDEKNQRMPGLWFDPKTDVIYFLKSMGNKKIKFSTKIKRPENRRALIFANARVKEMFEKPKATITPLIKDEIPKWFAVKQSENLDQRTYTKISQAILRIEPFWGGMFCNEIDDDNVAKWIDWLNEKFPGQQKFNAVKYMRNLAKYLARKQYNGAALLPAIPRIYDPDEKSDIAERKAKTERIFTAREFKKIFKTAETPEDALKVLFMYLMATRIEETLTLKFGKSLVRERGIWYYRWTFGQNKADHEGRHILHPEIARRLAALEKKRMVAGTHLLFPQARNNQQALKPAQMDWNAWRKRAGLGWNWTSKTFRHTCLSNLFADETIPQAHILKLYRVSLATALRVYVKPTQEGMRRLSKKLKAGI